MYIIDKEISYEFEVKKSRFITKLYRVYNLDEASTIIKNVNSEYKDATHVCYAYRIDNTIKFYDDGEPGGTAGLPIMDVINKKNMNYILAIVIRYFGGIKLGAGGLVRAYSKSVSEALKNVKLNLLVEGYKIFIETDYENKNNIEYLLKDNKNFKKEYNVKVKYTIEIEKIDLDKFIIYNPIIAEDIYIEKNTSLDY